MRAWLERLWYGDGRGGWLLAPLAALFALLVWARRAAFRRGWLSSRHPGKPVVVVGNLTVGGSGKTPFVAWLAGALQARGVSVGIVSRGYGGRAIGPVEVGEGSDPAEVGDEPVLLRRRSGARVVVARDRAAAALRLAPAVDLIIADDGLQHYRLARDLEILVVDGRRRYGNGRLLPAGPLREPLSRSADLRIVNGGTAQPDERAMTLVPRAIVELDSGARIAPAQWRGRCVHAVAGIGDPARFFAALRTLGLAPIEHPLPDHARLTAGDVTFGDALPVLMTEKDAVKCGRFPPGGLAYLEVAADFAAADAEAIVGRVLALVPRR
jgi:tetraacyldisaccharide 4'-kinase